MPRACACLATAAPKFSAEEGVPGEVVPAEREAGEPGGSANSKPALAAVATADALSHGPSGAGGGQPPRDDGAQLSSRGGTTAAQRARRQAALLPPDATAEKVAAAEQRLAPQSAQAARLTRAAGQHGPGTGIRFDGLLYVVDLLRRVSPGAFGTQAGVFVVDNGMGAGGVAYRSSSDPSRDVLEDIYTDDGPATQSGFVPGSVSNGTRVEAVQQTVDFIQVEDGRWLPLEQLKPAVRTVTTSDFIKAHIQPVTLPPGWIVEPEVTSAENSWYTHHYINQATGEERVKDGGQPDPPPGTYSMCAKLAADPETAHFIGAPTHFLSHAHTMDFFETFDSVKRYVSKLPPEKVATMYWWIDGFAIDQHECQYSPPAIDDNSAAWAQTFQEAISKMGNVVMVLNPWNEPLVLSRLWCLWELQCALATDSGFGICLSTQQEEAFFASLRDGEQGVATAMGSLSKIDVNLAKGSAKDTALIMGPIRAGPGGAERLNKTAVKQLRETFVLEKSREWVDNLRSASGTLETAEAVVAAQRLASLLGGQLGEWEEAKALLQEAVVAAQQLGSADSSGMLTLRMSLANMMAETGEVVEAREMLEDVLAKEMERFGPGDERVLTTQQNLAVFLSTELNSYERGYARYVTGKPHLLVAAQHQRGLPDYEAAAELFQAAVTGLTALHGGEADSVLSSRNGLAVVYQKLNRHDLARTEFQIVLEAQRKQLGKRNLSTLGTQYNLALLMHNEFQECEAAVAMMREVAEIRATVLGPGHQDAEGAAETLARWEQVAINRVALAELASTGSLEGSVVTWTKPDQSTFELSSRVAIGRVACINDTYSVTVNFPGGDVRTVYPSELELYTKEEDFVVGAVVSVSVHHMSSDEFADNFGLGGTTGEIIAVKDLCESMTVVVDLSDDDPVGWSRRLPPLAYSVRFPRTVMDMRPSQLELASSEQAAQWVTTKSQVDANAAALVVGASVVVCKAAGFSAPDEPVGSVGKLVEIIEDDDTGPMLMVMFPQREDLGCFGPEDLVLANAEQEAQLVVEMADRRTKDEAHVRSLAVGTAVVLTTYGTTGTGLPDVPEGTVGDIEAILDDGRLGVMFLFPGHRGAFKPEDLVVASNEQAMHWRALKSLCYAEDDGELDAGTRVRVSPYGDGTYVCFQRKRVGANRHTIDFDATGHGQQVVSFKDLCWSTTPDCVLVGMTMVEAEAAEAAQTEARKVELAAMSESERQSHEDKSCLQPKPTDCNGYSCDECGNLIPFGVVRFTCSYCRYDLCSVCQRHATASEPATSLFDEAYDEASDALLQACRPAGETAKSPATGLPPIQSLRGGESSGFGSSDLGGGGDDGESDCSLFSEDSD